MSCTTVPQYHTEFVPSHRPARAAPDRLDDWLNCDGSTAISDPCRRRSEARLDSRVGSCAVSLKLCATDRWDRLLLPFPALRLSLLLLPSVCSFIVAHVKFAYDGRRVPLRLGADAAGLPGSEARTARAYDPAAAVPKPEQLSATPAPPSTYGGTTAALQLATEPESSKSVLTWSICGCSLLVFTLSCIIALLSAAVIGLAAATGVEAQRATSAASSLADLRAAATAAAAAASASSTAASVIDDGCSKDPGSVDNTVYTAFSLLGALRFTRYCNKDAPHPPILSLFTADFDTCMDACAAYTKYVAPALSSSGKGANGNGNGNGSAAADATCAAVSFIPAWTDKATARAGGAPGNCYLKAGPQNASALTTPNIGVDCHAAVLTPAA
ncbi:uncharacterized protein THITE_2115561 [Thermothielavioides terrestris NRRL 8126]|uniref:Uncharacterized protein n=1 Tax=Thermothielavioides terrestris (strain ATCC 38088 / NRRL 8126) TaxID=578455 RepID=G2R4W8_THETT|nr:uncharacterized protein THITE_2115561 [Thermothielavioides terrestris NRRL 8126]AEO66953.1 hypothetical protein THITE_2115561 [Thermothielavioides terrestris NRRL 8126]